MGHAQRSYDTSLSSRVVCGGNRALVQLARLSTILPFQSREKRDASVASQHSVRGLQVLEQRQRRFMTPSATFSVDAVSPSCTSGDSQGACVNGYHSPSVINNPVTFVFEVEDTGHAIAVEHREAMFQNFVSLPNTSTRYGGTGVGLGIVRSLVQLMGGSIRIVDKVTPGTLFRFDISLERQEEPEVVERPLPPVERVRAAPDLVPLTGCGEARATPQRMFPRSHWDAAKWSRIDKVVSETLLQTHRRVLLVMPHEKMQSKVAATWFKRRGCQVTMESSWEGMRAAMEAMTQRYVKQTKLRNEPAVAQGNVDEKDRKVDKDGGFICLVLIDSALILHEQEVSPALYQLGSLRADIRRIQDRLSLSTGDLHNCTPPRISTALLITAATHPSLQGEARSNGCTLLQKPLTPSRLTPLLTFFDSTTHPTDRDRTFPVPSSQNTSEIAPVQPPHETNAAESLHKVSDCVINVSREDDAECAHKDESQRALKEPDVSTSLMRVQGPGFNGSITGEREQEQYLGARMQLDKSFSSSKMNPLFTVSSGVGDSTARDISTCTTSSKIAREHTQETRYAPDLHMHSCQSPETSSKEAAANDRVQSGEEYARALREPETLTAPTLVQRTDSAGGVVGRSEQSPQILTGVDAAARSAQGGTESVAIDVENDKSEWKDSLRLRRESQEVSVSGGIRQDTKEDAKRDTETVVEMEGRKSDVREGSLCEDKKGVPQTPHLNRLEDFTGLRILLVEDTPVMAQIATRQMEKIGAKVRWAQDGQVAVEMFTEIYGDQRRETEAEQSPKSFALKPGSFDDGFDVIVMDCQMPRLDGYGATAAIRELEKVLGIHTPIVALTAHAMTTDRKKCLDAGMDEYLAKPLNLALFKAMLAKLLKPEDS